MTRPTSITGGVRYDREPMPSERPATCRYFVAWNDVNGARHHVAVASWRGPMGASRLVVLRQRVARDMARFPPI